MPMSAPRAFRNRSAKFARALGASVRARRVYLGLRPTDLARRTGLAETVIVAIEAGESDLDLLRLAWVAAGLEFPLRTLLRRVERQIGWVRKSAGPAKRTKRPKRTRQNET